MHQLSSAARMAFVAIFAVLFLSSGANAELFSTKAKEAFMIDAETGTILYSKDADKLIPPASLAKLMTMEVVFHAIKSGRLSLDDKFYVSENAWKKGGAGSGGSTMFAKVKSEVPLEDLIQGVIVQSANDGCIAIAEGMAGSEDNFATLMTERARQIGLTKSVFKNATGLPADGQFVTVRELVMLARHLWMEYPEFYHYFAEPEFTWNGIKQRNRNPLLEHGHRRRRPEDRLHRCVRLRHRRLRQARRPAAVPGHERTRQRATSAPRSRARCSTGACAPSGRPSFSTTAR